MAKALSTQVECALDHPVRPVARGVILEEGVADHVVVGQWRQRRVPGAEPGSVRGLEPLVALDDLDAAREPTRGQRRRQQTVCRRLAGLQRLGHGPEHGLQPRRLGPRDSQRVQPALLVELEQTRAGRRGAEGAKRPGGMPAQRIVARTDERPQAALDLDSGHQCRQQLRPRTSEPFPEREHGGRHHHRGVSHQRHVHVVEVERVGGRPVDKRRRQCRGPGRPSDHRRLVAVGAGQLFDQDLRERLTRSGEGHAEPVQQALLSDQERVVGQLLKRDRASGRRESSGRGGG